MGSHGDWKSLGEGEVPVQDMDVGLGHIVTIKTYNRVFATLIALTVITIGAATFDLGWMNVPLALSIATFKAGIVTLYFMHLNFESKIIWGIVIYPLFILFLMILGTLGDEMVKKPVSPMVPYTEAEAEAAVEDSHSNQEHNTDSHH